MQVLIELGIGALRTEVTALRSPTFNAQGWEPDPTELVGFAQDHVAVNGLIVEQISHLPRGSSIIDISDGCLALFRSSS